MKTKLRKPIAVLIGLLLMISLLPMSALAVDELNDQYVLTNLTHTDATTTDGLTSATDRDITLTVPYSHSNTLDLTTGLTPTPQRESARLA